jgi:hypothetical protein
VSASAVTTEPTVSLTLDQAQTIFHLVTLIEDRAPEDQETILVLARFLDEHSGYPDACIDPCPYVHYRGECTRQPAGPAVSHADWTWEEGRPADAPRRR